MYQESLNEVSFAILLNLIAATRADGGLVFFHKGCLNGREQAGYLSKLCSLLDFSSLRCSLFIYSVFLGHLRAVNFEMTTSLCPLG